jgi:hypothetical protein
MSKYFSYNFELLEGVYAIIHQSKKNCVITSQVHHNNKIGKPLFCN